MLLNYKLSNHHALVPPQRSMQRNSITYFHQPLLPRSERVPPVEEFESEYHMCVEENLKARKQKEKKILHVLKTMMKGEEKR